jgi:hypothetical protein
LVLEVKRAGTGGRGTARDERVALSGVDLRLEGSQLVLDFLLFPDFLFVVVVY